MKKFVVIRKFPLDFLGEAWKDAYINFQAFSLQDIRTNATAFSELDQNNSEQVGKSFDTILGLLEDRFVDGKAVSEGQLVDLEKEDLKALPFQVHQEAIAFLSQTPPKTSKTP